MKSQKKRVERKSFVFVVIQPTFAKRIRIKSDKRRIHLLLMLVKTHFAAEIVNGLSRRQYRRNSRTELNGNQTNTSLVD